MRSLMIEILVLFGMSLLTFGSIADAAGPAQADFDICNAEAHTRAASPSAAPATGGDTATKPGTPVSPSAAAATETASTPSPSPAPGADTGSKSGTPVSPSAAPVTQPPATPSPAPTTGTGAGTGAGRITDSTSPGTPSASDDLSRGMAAAGQADPAFRHAYVACMKRRGF